MGKFSRLLRLAFLLLAGAGAAQESIQEKYPFLNLEQNDIKFYGDSTRFNIFFDRLDELMLKGEGQVNILHMGGSHVQGGVLSHSMRKHMISLAPGLKGQRGLIFPFTLAKTNNPWNYRVKSTGNWEGFRSSVDKHRSKWGVSGVTAKTTDSYATASIYSRYAADDFGFTRARIFYDMSARSFMPRITDGSASSICFDSTAQYVEFTFKGPRDTLNLGFFKQDSTRTEFLLQGIQLVSPGPAIIYNPIGVNGASTDDYLRAEDFTRQLKMLPPDLVIFGIGINDANMPERLFRQDRYEGYYQALIDRIREANPEVAILFMTNNDSYYRQWYPNKNAIAVRRAMINLSRRNNGAIWDLFEVMGGLNSVRIWEEFDLARPDKIHFSREGYELQAELLFSAIKKSYGEYLQLRYKQQP